MLAFDIKGTPDQNETGRLTSMIKRNRSKRALLKIKRPDTPESSALAKGNIAKDALPPNEEIERRQREAVMHQNGISEK